MKKLLLGASALLVACGANPPAPSADAPMTGPLPVAADQGEAQPIMAVTTSSVVHPDWSRDAVIYQINTRQYSREGTFAKVEEDLPRLKELGVDILWLMPIHPIGEAKRKGTMGSPYAVKDFRAVNPELGTLDDFKSLVNATHAHGMKIIIDWVANHTAWDNHLITDHPEWYTRDADSNMQHPEETDWVDVADLDYTQSGLRDYMSDALVYWVEEIGIDGYRCDVAGMVPTDFWNEVRPRLDTVKPTFMLAEWQQPELHEKAFSASYAWRWKEIMQDVVKGEAGVSDILGYYADYQRDWPRDAMRMTYTSNHDQNTWDGTPFDIYGDALEMVMALQFVGEGIPLIYNGQEMGNDKRLEFFEKELINWKEGHPYEELFAQFIDLKTNNIALHNAHWGGRLVPLATNNPENVLSFVREKDGNKVIGLFNFTDEPQSVRINDEAAFGEFQKFNTGEIKSINTMTELTLEPWGYHIFTHG